MAGMSVKLLTAEETRQLFKYDEYFQSLIQDSEINPQALKILYNGTSSVAFTEIGTAMTAEFKGANREAGTVLCSTRVLTPGGSYFNFYVTDGTTITTYYAWFSKYEVFTAVCLAAADITTGTYFEIVDSQGAPTSYYVWMDKNGDGVTDDPGHATFTGVQCNISAATTAADVATIVAAAINGLAGFGASAATDTVTATCATKGDPTDAVDVDTTFVITVTENGGADPSATGTGAECDIKAATTAANVATIVQGVINALADVTATVSTATVTIENDVAHGVTQNTDNDTGFTFTRTQISANDHGGAPVSFVSASADDTDLITKDMRKLNVIGFTETELKEEEVKLSGTTLVETTELLWKRIIHHGGSDWGSAGQDAKGNVSMKDFDGTTAFLVTTATYNESEGGVIWVPNNFHIVVPRSSLIFDDLTVGADGGIVKLVTSGFDNTKNNRIYNTDPDNPAVGAIEKSKGSAGVTKKWLIKSPIHGTDVAKITLMEGAINNAQGFIFKITILIWYKKN